MPKFFVAHGVADVVAGFWVEAPTVKDALEAIKHVDIDDPDSEIYQTQAEMTWVFDADSEFLPNEGGLIDPYTGDSYIPWSNAGRAVQTDEFADTFSPDGTPIDEDVDDE